MSEERIRELLRADPTAAEREAEERGWAVVKAAYAERSVSPPPRSHRSLALALAGAALLLALALSPAGAQVADWIEDVVQPGEEDAAPSLTALPAPGRLLVESEQGPWIVSEDGSKRMLGAYDRAAWSPNGRFVAVARGRELTAVVADTAATGEPIGNPRWSLAAARPIDDIAWSPSGIRVAFVAGGKLRVVAGDGTNERFLAGGVAPAAPQWRPLSPAELRRVDPATGVALGARNTLAYVDGSSAVRVIDVDSGRLLWRSASFVGGIRALTWTADGRRLAIMGAGGYAVYRADGQPLLKGPTPDGVISGAFSPDGNDLALIRHLRNGSASAVSVIDVDAPPANARPLYTGPGTFNDPTWSPDGSTLLVGWPAADQWLFLDPGAPGEPKAVAGIARQFDPGGKGPAAFPHISGWCCAP